MWTWTLLKLRLLFRLRTRAATGRPAEDAALIDTEPDSIQTAAERIRAMETLPMPLEAMSGSPHGLGEFRVSSPAEVLSLPVLQKFTSTHTRKGRQYLKYHLQLAPPTNGRIPTPGVIDVPGHLYGSTRERGVVDVTLRRGALGLPWIEALRAR